VLEIVKGHLGREEDDEENPLGYIIMITNFHGETKW